MNNFFLSIEKQAYRIAYIGCSNHEDALDLVQDAMCRFVDKYSNKPEAEWKALFYRILQNKIRDYYRKQAVRKRWMFWLNDADESAADPLEELAVDNGQTPEEQSLQKQSFDELEQALKQLSHKQQQIFLLRAWQGLSTRETAQAMGCAEGTIKTQYFRASNKLKELLGKDWP